MITNHTEERASTFMMWVLAMVIYKLKELGNRKKPETQTRLPMDKVEAVTGIPRTIWRWGKEIATSKVG